MRILTAILCCFGLCSCSRLTAQRQNLTVPEMLEQKGVKSARAMADAESAYYAAEKDTKNQQGIGEARRKLQVAFLNFYGEIAIKNFVTRPKPWLDASEDRAVSDYVRKIRSLLRQGKDRGHPAS